MKHNFFFDLDGTLVDTLPGITASLNAAIARATGEFTPLRTCDVRQLIGPPVSSILRSLTPPEEEWDVEQMVSVFRRAYDTTGWRQSREFNGVRNALTWAKAAQKRLFLVTNKPLFSTTNILHLFGFDHFFDGVITPDSSTPAFRSKADMLRRLVERHGVEWEDCLMIGDTAEDYTAAKSIGMEALCVSYGYGWERVVTDYPQCRIVQNLGVIRNEFREPAIAG